MIIKQRTRICLTTLAVILIMVMVSGCSSQSPTHLRVMSYNIHHGEGTDGRFDLRRLARVIRKADPDLVSLQEVDRRTQRSSGTDQAEELATLTGMYYAYGKAIDFQGGGYGVAVLSRYPLDLIEIHALPYTPGYEARVLLLTRIHAPGISDLYFGATHLQHNLEEDRIAQAGEIVIATSDKNVVNGPVILAGDFNAQPDEPPMKILKLWFEDAAGNNPQPTWPSSEPRVRIDYVLLKPGDDFQVLQTEIPDEPVASDHLPLVTDITYRKSTKQH